MVGQAAAERAATQQTAVDAIEGSGEAEHTCGVSKGCSGSNSQEPRFELIGTRCVARVLSPTKPADRCDIKRRARPSKNPVIVARRNDRSVERLLQSTPIAGPLHLQQMYNRAGGQRPLPRRMQHQLRKNQLSDAEAREAGPLANSSRKVHAFAIGDGDAQKASSPAQLSACERFARRRLAAATAAAMCVWTLMTTVLKWLLNVRIRSLVRTLGVPQPAR